MNLNVTLENEVKNEVGWSEGIYTFGGISNDMDGKGQAVVSYGSKSNIFKRNDSVKGETKRTPRFPIFCST